MNRIARRVTDETSWQYARTNSHEYVAELYAKGIHMPELLHHDLVDGPARELAEAIAAAGEHPDAVTQAHIERLRAVANSKQQQWDIMRAQVFGVTDDVVEDRVSELEGLGDWSGGADMDDTLSRFRADAARAMTPYQLDLLVDRYVTRRAQSAIADPWLPDTSSVEDVPLRQAA